MITIVNVGKRKFTIMGEQGSQDLAPSREVKVKKDHGESLAASFPQEIKIKHEEHVKVEIKEVKEEVKPEAPKEVKKGNGKK